MCKIYQDGDWRGRMRTGTAETSKQIAKSGSPAAERIWIHSPGCKEKYHLRKRTEVQTPGSKERVTLKTRYKLDIELKL